MKNKKIAAVILSVAMVVTGISCSQPVYAKKVSISDKKMILKVKEKKKLKLKNTSKKVTWKLSTKKYVTIKKVKKNCIYVIGKRAGKTKITAKLGKKKYSCLVTVKKAVGKNDTKKSTEKPSVTKIPAQNIKSTITPTKQPTMTPEVIDEEKKDEISYADGVTSKMTKTKFWLNMSSKTTKPLMKNDEIKNLNIEKYFSDIDIQSFTGGKYDSISSYRGEIFFSKYDSEKCKCIRCEKIGYAIALSQEQNFSSVSFLDVNVILFEEFMSRTVNDFL